MHSATLSPCLLPIDKPLGLRFPFFLLEPIKGCRRRSPWSRRGPSSRSSRRRSRSSSRGRSRRSRRRRRRGAGSWRRGASEERCSGRPRAPWLRRGGERRNASASSSKGGGAEDTNRPTERPKDRPTRMEGRRKGRRETGERAAQKRHADEERQTTTGTFAVKQRWRCSFDSVGAVEELLQRAIRTARVR